MAYWKISRDLYNSEIFTSVIFADYLEKDVPMLFLGILIHETRQKITFQYQLVYISYPSMFGIHIQILDLLLVNVHISCQMYVELDTTMCEVV